MTPDHRRRRRRVLYLVGLLPSILLLLLSARIVLALQQESGGMEAYDAARFDEARRHFAANRVLDPLEPWVAPFDEGDARFRLADFPGAVAAFEAALERVPEDHECLVRVNLALAYEAVGDKALESGDRQQATDAWQTGRESLGGCPRPAGAPPRPPEDEVTRVAAVRVDARLARKLGGDPEVTPPRPEKPPAEDQRTKEKERKLDERNKQALVDHVQHRNDFDPPPPTQPPSPSPSPPVPQW